MQAVVIYDSQFGNTKQIAQAIARGLGEHGSVEILPASEVIERLPATPDLLVVGGPTQRHGLSPTLRAFFDTLPRDGVGKARAATFDTRYRMPPLISGSAARQAAGRLRRAGCRLVAAPESFYVVREKPADGEKARPGTERLEPDELERALEWGRGLATAALSHG